MKTTNIRLAAVFAAAFATAVAAWSQTNGRGHASPWRGGGEEQVAANSCKGRCHAHHCCRNYP